ncbi:hypothetical protein [Streptococcus saliviloxodontae]|uniref:DUF5648 domain-containing protein n=1 Tax=Streptococcus saliviloxodontae TaxID=1349416 RepID=A0ABS2PKB6_9STRE|nr:hypothetical protein [Streptococcus saliviloxodontae]MBM7635874.1 hypothetical protein [Streptococcus saliviloxodontae]
MKWKLTLGAIAVFSLLAVSEQTFADSSIYRLYNPTLKEHLFTSDTNEYDVLSSKGWNQEGLAWYAPDNGQQVTRLYSKITHKHLYTTDQNEVSVLTRSGAWVQDAMSFYSGGDTPIYRLYHEGIKTHLLTADTNEYQTLAGAWNQEGVKLYATALPDSDRSSSIAQPTSKVIKTLPVGEQGIENTPSTDTIEADVSLTGSGTGYHAKLVMATATSAISFGIQYDTGAGDPDFRNQLAFMVENVASNASGQQAYSWTNHVGELGQTYHIMLTLDEATGNYAGYINGSQVITGNNAMLTSQAIAARGEKIYLRTEGSGRKEGDNISASFSNVKLKTNGVYDPNIAWTTHFYQENPGVSISGDVTNHTISGIMTGMGTHVDWDSAYESFSGILQYDNVVQENPTSQTN